MRYLIGITGAVMFGWGLGMLIVAVIKDLFGSDR
jgi:hypothetical protein